MKPTAQTAVLTGQNLIFVALAETLYLRVADSELTLTSRTMLRNAAL
jgi:hypothetical protein